MYKKEFNNSTMKHCDKTEKLKTILVKITIIGAECTGDFEAIISLNF